MKLFLFVNIWNEKDSFFIILTEFASPLHLHIRLHSLRDKKYFNELSLFLFLFVCVCSFSEYKKICAFCIIYCSHLFFTYEKEKPISTQMISYEVNNQTKKCCMIKHFLGQMAPGILLLFLRN